MWTAARLLLGERKGVGGARAALARRALPEGAGDWEAFGREIVARAFGEAPAPGPWAETIRAHANEASSLLEFIAARLFTAGEREALIALSIERHGEGRTRNATAIPREHVGRVASGPPMRTLEWPAAGFASDLLRVVGCAVRRGNRRVHGTLRYAPDGSIVGASIDPTGVSPACLRAGKGALMLAVAAPRAVAASDVKETVLIVFEPEAIACSDAHQQRRRADVLKPTGAPDPKEVDRRITAPKRTRHVNPEYPDAVQRAAIQGVVILEATITTEGCITSLEQLRGVHPALDLAAFDAVLGWRYTPTLLDGEPVSVNMTVTVNFTLR